MNWRVNSMSDIFILYSVFSYLFLLGLIQATWKEVGSKAMVGAFVCLITAPGSMPIILGTLLIK
jgi:hypothetical protein